MAQDQENLRSLVDASGFAFQLAVEHLVHVAGGRFKVLATEHAWVHPRTHETGFADIILEDEGKFPVLRLIVECKRVRDGQWVFLRPDEGAKRSRTRFAVSPEDAKSHVIAHWTAVDEQRKASGTDRIACTPSTDYSSFCVVRGSGENQTPMLERVAAQLLEATEGIAHEQFLLDLAHRMNHRLGQAWAYVPVIVTTAQLSVCDFNPAEVDIANGLLPANAAFVGVPVVRFTKNLSFDVDANQQKTLTTANAAKDRTVFVVNAASFSEFLQKFDWSGGMPEALRAFFG